jgi:hypothetical protein
MSGGFIASNELDDKQDLPLQGPFSIAFVGKPSLTLGFT